MSRYLSARSHIFWAPSARGYAYYPHFNKKKKRNNIKILYFSLKSEYLFSYLLIEISHTIVSSEFEHPKYWLVEFIFLKLYKLKIVIIVYLFSI